MAADDFGSGDVLRLLNSKEMLGALWLPRAIYRRPEVYPPLFKLLQELKSSGTKNLILTGTPGIGKTYFLYYVLWCLARMMAAGDADAPTHVVFERQVGSGTPTDARVLFRKGQPPLVGPRDAFRTELLMDTKCWCACSR